EVALGGHGRVRVVHEAPVVVAARGLERVEADLAVVYHGVAAVGEALGQRLAAGGVAHPGLDVARAALAAVDLLLGGEELAGIQVVRGLVAAPDVARGRRGEEQEGEQGEPAAVDHGKSSCSTSTPS